RTQVWHQISGEDTGHGPSRDTELVSDPARAAPLAVTQLKNALLKLITGAQRARARSRGPIVQAGLAFAGIPTEPLGHALTRQAHRLADVGLRPAIPVTLNDQQPTPIGRADITMGHESLLVTVQPSTSHTPPGGSPHVNAPLPQPTPWLGTPSAVSGNVVHVIGSRMGEVISPASDFGAYGFCRLLNSRY